MREFTHCNVSSGSKCPNFVGMSSKGNDCLYYGTAFTCLNKDMAPCYYLP